MITSGCRAQALRLFPLFRDRSDILMIATDGLASKTRIVTPRPEDTGTFDCFKREKDGRMTNVPLGGWEESELKKGLFLARPGIYFPTSPTEDDIAKIKGRGVGSGVVLKNHKLISESWAQYEDSRKVTVYGIERFCGAKTSVHYSRAQDVFSRASSEWPDEGRRVKPSYGEWIERSVVMDFAPKPKRDGLSRRCGSYAELGLRSIPASFGESLPYTKAFLGPESAQLKAMQAEMEEQPDLDYESSDEAD
jgi:hypothetical protein